MLWASCLCVNVCDKVCRSISVTQNDQQKYKTKVNSISHVISLKVENQFLLSKNAIEHIRVTLIKFEVQTL